MDSRLRGNDNRELRAITRIAPTVYFIMADLSFNHLQLEFARLDVLLHQQMQMVDLFSHALNEAEAANATNRLYLSAAQIDLIMKRPFGAAYTPEDKMVAHYETIRSAAENEISAVLAYADENNEPLRLQQLVVAMGLSRFELDCFLLAIAPQVDGRFGRLYAFLQDDMTQKRPSLGMILDVLADSEPGRLQYLTYFRPDAPLLRHKLVQLTAAQGEVDSSFIHQTLLPDPALISWLLTGDYEPPAQLQTRLTYTADPIPDLPLLTDAMQTDLMKTAVNNDILVFTGKDELSRQTAASLMASGWELSLLSLKLVEKAENEQTLDDIRHLLRDSLLNNGIAHISNWDVCLKDDAPPATFVEVICAHPLPVIISGEKWWQPRQIDRTRHMQWFTFPLPDSDHRARVLAHFLEEEEENESIKGLAGQFRLTAGQLRDLVDTATDTARQNGRLLQPNDLFAAARAHSSSRLSTLATKITPRYGWDDLVLSNDQIDLLREMVDSIRHRPLVLEAWGVGKKLAASAGITALFYGPPGTGKTMGAEVIASELGLDLYKIDLSTMVSKYIGETEKNLEKIFTEAESSNAILFFDEADAIFGKRSEVKESHDRYANIQISYLLQRMESFDGVTILATNLKANLDEAFTRRLQFAISYPFPKADDRLRIWQSLMPDSIPVESDLDLERMAEQFELAGGNIRNIIIGAAYLAASNGQVLKNEHLLHGARRELQKMGRLVKDSDFELNR